MGNTDANRELSQEHLQTTKWKRQAAELFALLTRNTQSKFPEGISELAIVPDRSLWYAPFAALQLGPQDHTEPLISKLRLRFAPTTGLAVGDSRGLKRQMNALVALGRIFPRHDSSVSETAFQELAQVMPGAVALHTKPPAPSHVLSSVVDRLIVLDEIDTTENVYGWSPFQTDQGAPGASLTDWMLLPWGAPDQILLPGFHSSAANSLKGRSIETAGDDLFLNICGLMAAGSRTILISQWRTGGQTSFDLVRELVQELPHTAAADAWQRSVSLVMAQPFNSEAEPRIARSKRSEESKAEHPFFWAGYLLVDQGSAGQNPDDPQVGLAMNAPAEPDAAANAQAGGAAPVQLGGPAAPADGAAAIGGFAGDKPQPDSKRTRKRPAPKTNRPRRPAAEPAASGDEDVQP
jgi:hypothetical protein